MIESKWLYDNENIRQFNPKLAKVVGLNESIVLQQIHYWLKINMKAGNNIKENRCWTYNTFEEWKEKDFYFWSLSTIKRTFKSLEEKGLLIVDNFNKMKLDKTKWYSINYEKLNEIMEENLPATPEMSRMSQNDTMDSVKTNQRTGQNDTMDSVKMTRPITKDLPKTSSKTSSSSTFGSSNSYPTLSKLERTDGGHRKYPKEFEDLWEVYPKRQGSNAKGGAYKKFRARMKEDISYKKIFEGIKTYMVEQKNQNNIGTPYVMQMQKFLGEQNIWLEYAEKDLTKEGGNDKVSKGNGRKEKTIEEQKEEWKKDFANFSG